MKKSLAIVALLFVVAGVGPGLSAQSTQPVVFNVTDYLNVYPDLMNVYGLDTDDVINHWTGAGLPAGYRGNLIFDAQYYLQNNPDVQAEFGPTNYVGAAQHFLQTGLPFEGRRGSLEFDVKYYLAHNSDLAAAFGATGYQQAAAREIRGQGRHWRARGFAGLHFAAAADHPQFQSAGGLQPHLYCVPFQPRWRGPQIQRLRYHHGRQVRQHSARLLGKSGGYTGGRASGPPGSVHWPGHVPNQR